MRRPRSGQGRSTGILPVAFTGHGRDGRATTWPTRWAVAMVFAGLAFPGSAEDGLVSLNVYPPEVELTTQRDRQSFVVQAEYADRMTRDVTSEAAIQLETEGVVRREGNILHPSADGETSLSVSFGGREQRVPVRVTQATAERPISFRLDVMPVFMKADCNTGSCHGSALGQDGFHLSLFGYDPAGDYFRLTREMNGRRINVAAPEESLLIQKATGQVPHTGGELLTPDSEQIHTLLRWLNRLAPDDDPGVATVLDVELMPPAMVLAATEGSQQLTVRAIYSDGTDRDVTDLAVFISNNDISAAVSGDGVVTAGKRGEAFVTARYDAFTVGSPVIVVPGNMPYTFPAIDPENYIDELVFEKLRKLKIVPSDLCDDATYIRRASIDLVGRLPTREEVDSFVVNPDPGKRAHLVDALLTRKEFTELWVMYWAEQLQIRSSNQISYKSALLYYNWLKERIAGGTPMNEMVRELLSASGGTFQNPATTYYQMEEDTLQIAENTAQIFGGIQMQCAQCHNHPFDRWTQDDYYGFASFFAQIGRKRTDDPRDRVVFDRNRGEVKHPVTTKDVPPKFLGGESLDPKKPQRRLRMAEWLTAPENPYFARNLANRTWAHFFGRGIVDPVDDVRISNPPVNEALLAALAERLVGYNYDFKKLVRDICLSRTYQLSSRTNDTNATDDRNFSRAAIRRIRAEVLLDCISQVTETQDKFKGLPRGARAIQIADGNTSTYFLNTFGRARRDTPCTCEVVVEPNLSQALHLLNGEATHQKVREGEVVKRLLDEGRTPFQVIEELYVRCLARPPSPVEKERLGTEVAALPNPREALEDVFWALLNSKEFVFNH